MKLRRYGGLSFLALVVLLLCMPRQTDSLENYVIDTLVAMDQEAFSRWVSREPASLTAEEKTTEATKKVKEYMSLVVRQANLRLNSLTDDSNDWTLQMSVTGFSVGENPLVNNVHLRTKSISAESAVETFALWVAAKGYNTQYDYVILLTGCGEGHQYRIFKSSNEKSDSKNSKVKSCYVPTKETKAGSDQLTLYNLDSLTSPINDVQGIANVGSLCHTDGSSVTVVEDKGGYQSVQILAHEMGHSLGSVHDGQSPNTACPNQDRYLMSINSPEATSATLLNPWSFSSCSKQVIGNYMTQTLLKDYASCVKDSKPAAAEYTATDVKLPGQVYDAYDQCQHLYGPESRLCTGSSFGDRGDICTAMFCLDKSAGSNGFRCSKNQAAEGTTCGNHKACHLGRCVDNPLAPEIGVCPDGDSPVKLDGKFTCEEYIKIRPMVCYQAPVEAACCKSCGDVLKQSQVCPYGDKVTGCTSDLCKLIDVNGTRLEEQCCGVCGYDVPKTCSDVTVIDGMTCEQRVKLNGIQSCYDWSVAYQCCKTCETLRTGDVGCEYGDRQDNCKFQATDEATCQQHAKRCCHTCKDGFPGNGSWSLQISTTTHYYLLLWLLSVRCFKPLFS